ncbi:MAG: ABC transporter permease [Candidatus Limnocylindrales bacterium]
MGTGLLLAIGRRLASMLVTLLGVAITIFLILRVLPGDAVTASLGVSAGLLTRDQLAALDRFYGIGEPPVQQFASWLGALLSGNLGVSLAARVPVASLIGTALPVTFEIAVLAMALGLLIGVSFGVLGALRPGHLADDVGQGLAVIGLGVPSFVIGTALVTFLASTFHYFPSSLGFVGFLQNPWLNLQQVFFPALTLSLGIGAAIMRTTRAAVLEVTSLNFVRTARGKGLSPTAVAWRHILPNALVPIVTMSGIQLGYLLGGTVIVEQIFVLPGLGRLLVTSISNRDFPVVQSITVLFAASFVIVNMLTDILYTIIDPRTRAR